MLFIFTRVCVWVLVWVYYALGIYMAITRQPHDVQGSVQFCTSVGSPRSMGNPCRQRMLVDGIKRSRGDGVRCNVCYVQRSAIAATLGERRLMCILVLSGAQVSSGLRCSTNATRQNSARPGSAVKAAKAACGIIFAKRASGAWWFLELTSETPGRLGW